MEHLIHDTLVGLPIILVFAAEMAVYGPFRDIDCPGDGTDRRGFRLGLAGQAVGALQPWMSDLVFFFFS